MHNYQNMTHSHASLDYFDIGMLYKAIESIIVLCDTNWTEGKI
jgi:hypothetical protein